MKQRRLWLFALLSILAFVMTPCLATAASSGNLEVGGVITGVDDNTARVNEYVKNRTDDGGSASIKLNAEGVNENSAFDLDVDLVDGDTFKLETGFDFARMFKLDISLDSFQHWKDHETLSQMGGTAREDTGGAQPSVTTDKIFADLAALATPITAVGGVTLNYDAATAYAQELNNDYIVTRREIKTETELALPVLPNIVFHAGLRIETREGLEQAIGLSKCDGCHVSAVGKNIDERTQDFTFGATGKFGQLTVEYEYLNRKFDEDGATPVRYYENAGNPSANDQLLYEAGDFGLNRTPDSEKDSHLLKARYDFSKNTTLSASYTKADLESDKSDPASDISYSLANDTLKTDFESFGGKLATRFGNWKLSARANTYSIDADDNIVERRDDLTTRDDSGLLSFELAQEWHSAEARDVDEFGLDAVYRLSKGTTLRLGYDYEKIDREEHELGETETSSYKVSLKSRITDQLSGRISYKYQDISNPLDNPTGIAQGLATATQDPLNPGLWFVNKADYFSVDGNSATTVWYWNSVYPNRTLDATNLPDSVHEVKLNATWAPSANMAATLFARIRSEENDEVGYDQDTFVPGLSFWYAPNSKLNLTMAYTFSKQDTENRMCVGWYHG